MKKILILGAGRVGRLLARLLHESHDYEVILSDTQPIQTFNSRAAIRTVALDASDVSTLMAFLKQESIAAVVSCLPYFLNQTVAGAAHGAGVAYFDLTEDVAVTQLVKELAKTAKAPMVPQCGLAPGFVSIVAADLAEKLETIESLDLRVGALPQSSNHPLKYAITWSVEGLINEYCHLCPAVIDHQVTQLFPLEGLEHIQILGIELEAFNTSGGIGSLIESYGQRATNITYKTLRYPGHAKHMQFLLNDLNLKNDRDTLKHILVKALPEGAKDCVYIYVCAKGWKNGKRVEETFIKKYEPTILFDEYYSALALTTAASCTAVVDMVMQQKEMKPGLVRQESFRLIDFFKNQFGRYLA